MGWCPFAVAKPLHPENESQPKITPLQLILHTAVTDAGSLYGYFSRLDVGTESHFFIAKDGTLEQYVDTEVRADAQFDGNLHGVSVETWDNRDPDNTPLTDAQVATFVRLARWLHDVHGMPLTVCPGPQEPGVGYHSLFPVWAKDGHTCPNGLRITQFREVIVPALHGDDDVIDQAAFDKLCVQVDALFQRIGHIDDLDRRIQAIVEAEVAKVPAGSTAKPASLHVQGELQVT